MITVATEKWGWKELASTITEDHSRDGQSATFVFSGAQVGMYMGELVVESEGEPEMSVVGEELSKKKLRKFFWENFAGMDTPSDVVKTVVVWTGYDEDRDESWVGLGKVVRQLEDK